LLGPDLVGFQSLVISVVPLANIFRENMVRCLGEVVGQEVEGIMSTTTRRYKDGTQFDRVDEFSFAYEEQGLRFDLLSSVFGERNVGASGMTPAYQTIEERGCGSEDQSRRIYVGRVLRSKDGPVKRPFGLACENREKRGVREMK